MKKFSTVILISFLLFFFHWFHGSGYGWGFFAHKWINRRAVDALPATLRPFFERHRTFLSEHSIDPDLWRKNDPKEGVRHYIDIDMYGAYPFEELPREFAAAKKKFGAKTVNDRGIAPWWILRTFDALVRAMRAADEDSMLVYAAALGHYVSDVHMPLHTAENYDGQFTGNKGIHSRFERWMIEQYADSLKITPGEAKLIENPLAFAFEVVLDSYLLCEKLLAADTRAKLPDKTYAGRSDYDPPYYASLFRQTKEIAETQMSRAATAVASLWYSAWVKAGKPALGEPTTQ